MALSVIAEISQDEKTLILIADGHDYEVAHAAREIAQITPKAKASNPKGALVVPVSFAAVVQLNAIFGTRLKKQPRLQAWMARQVMLRVPSVEPALEAIPPAGLEPRQYQVEGAALFASTGRALFFDEPGTGKTITSILGVVERSLVADVLPVLVVCPASVVDNWVNEFRKWAPHWWATAWRGSKSRRENLIGTSHVYVVSYDTCRNDASSADPRDGNPLIALRARTVIADECHRIKSHQSQQSKAVRRLAEKAEHFIGLSGTPITHHPGDLWPTLAALEPVAWPSRERWVNRYCSTIPGDYDQKILGLHPATEPEFRTILTGQHRRVAKADVLTQLPPKVYSVRYVELPPAYRKAYDEMEKTMLAELPDGEELSVMTVLAQLTRLSQLACAAADVDVELVVDPNTLEESVHQKVTLKAPSWKVDALLEILAERPGQPVVTCAPSRQLMMLAGERATAEGYRVGYVVGGQKPAERTQMIEDFQAGKLDLICVTTQAGGVGITLTAASTIVFLQRPWSLVDALQMEDRIHRIGSEIHDSVEVIDVVASNTIDTRVRSVLKGKAGQLADLLNDQRIVEEILGGINKKKAA